MDHTVDGVYWKVLVHIGSKRPQTGVLPAGFLVAGSFCLGYKQRGPRMRVMQTNLLHVELDGKMYEVPNAFFLTVFKVKGQSGTFTKGSKGAKCESKTWRFMVWYLARSVTHPTTQSSPPGHRNCSFICHVNSPGNIQPYYHHGAGNYSNTQKPPLSYTRYPLTPGSRVHVSAKCLA